MYDDNMAPPIKTIADALRWSYANLAMAHAAKTAGIEKYGQVQFMIRARLFKGLSQGTMQVGSLIDDERIKVDLAGFCSYCGARTKLTVDHLIPRMLGGKESSDNVVWCCRSCNSSKGARDLVAWYLGRDQFPPLMLLRRYLKLAMAITEEAGMLDVELGHEDLDALPFAVELLPLHFPAAGDMVLTVTVRCWSTDIAARD
jgi:hypothetical protein